MPKVVDHEARQRQITDAVCRITLQGGLGAATFRQVATEAGVSVRLVQYYFGTKENLLNVTQQHVGERSIARLTRWIEDTDGSPREVLGAFLKSFMPIDDEAMVAMLMYIALGAESVVGERSPDAPTARQTEGQMMLAMAEEQIRLGSTVPGIDPKTEAAIITGMMPGLGHYILDGTMSLGEVSLTIDYHLDRVFGTTGRAPSPLRDPAATKKSTKATTKAHTSTKEIS